MKKSLLILSLAVFAAAPLRAADTGTASTAINTLGIDLLAKTSKPDENALLSPYSIQGALAMTYAGASGKTRDEMSAVLHFPKESAEVNASFAALAKELASIEKSTAQIVAGAAKHGGSQEPVTLSVANRLYGQKGFEFRKTFLDAVKENYSAPLEQVDFLKDAGPATKLINTWVAGQTHDRIHDLLPDGALTKDTRLVLVNAIYLKAAWEHEFKEASTKPGSFYVNQSDAHEVPMMNREAQYGYAKKEGFTAVAIPYIGGDLQCLVLLPDSPNGLPALEARLSPSLLADCAKLESTNVNLFMPKLKMEPPLMELSAPLKTLGMGSAFDDPKGSANFDGIAPHKPKDYLFISDIFHKIFLSLDEHGTEAAAATAVVIMTFAAEDVSDDKPKEVRVDHPFIFAIQDRKSGACLFLGRVNDPR